MGLIDLILNLACVLLWINWRSVQIVAPGKSPPLSLVSTLKKAEPHRGTRWLSLGSVVALLGIRSLFYWNIGPAVNWTPNLDLGAVSLPFRSDYFWRIFLFSILSFALALGIFYASLLAASVINRRVPNDEKFQRLVRVHLGRIERWPTAAKMLLPMLLSTLIWGLGSPGLVRVGIVPPPASARLLWEQAVLLGLTSFLAWKYLALAVCVLYLVNSYVYLGNSSFWHYVNTTGSNLLQPLRRFPVCIGKLDLSPALGIVLVLAIDHWASQWLPRLYQRLPF